MRDTALLRADPARFLTDFYLSFNREVIGSDADPGPAVDRFHTPDVVQVSDGLRFDREKIVAHVRPLRRNLAEVGVEVHEAVADGGRVAARLTFRARMRKGRTVETEVFMFAEFAPDGRMRRSHGTSRTLDAGGPE
ncbi:nuclear transport factor 2 family protein [Spirillospora sp. NPDC050679]